MADHQTPREKAEIPVPEKETNSSLQQTASRQERIARIAHLKANLQDLKAALQTKKEAEERMQEARRLRAELQSELNLLNVNQSEETQDMNARAQLLDRLDFIECWLEDLRIQDSPRASVTQQAEAPETACSSHSDLRDMNYEEVSDVDEDDLNRGIDRAISELPRIKAELLNRVNAMAPRPPPAIPDQAPNLDATSPPNTERDAELIMEPPGSSAQVVLPSSSRSLSDILPALATGAVLWVSDKDNKASRSEQKKYQVEVSAKDIRFQLIQETGGSTGVKLGTESGSSTPYAPQIPERIALEDVGHIGTVPAQTVPHGCIQIIPTDVEYGDIFLFPETELTLERWIMGLKWRHARVVLGEEDSD